MLDQVQGFVLSITPIFTCLYLASLGNSIVEKSGILNLAIDGAYTLGTAMAFIAVASVRNPTLALIITSFLIGLLGILIAFLTTKLPISHGAVGLSTQFVGYGLASFLAYPVSIKVRNEGVPLNTYLPVTEVVLSYLIISLLIGVITHVLMYRSRLGVAIRAVGENPAVASSLGTNVLGVRVIAAFMGYILIGVASSLYILLYTKNWQEGAGMGYGWISFAISISAGRHPLVGMVTSLIFASLIRYAYVLQDILISYGINVSNYAVIAMPFIAAIIIPLTASVIPQMRRRFTPPKHLGKIFFSEERSV